MKINGQVYAALEGEALETQTCGEHKVELYSLNQYPDILEEFVYRGKFAVWSSVDGENYKLAIEDGYREKLSELYTQPVNNIWIQFWDECDVISRKFSKLMLPMTLCVFAALIGAMFIPNEKLSLGLTMGLAIVYVFVVLVLRKLTTNKINVVNKASLDKLKKHVGKDRFDELLQAQRDYIDEYFEALDKQAEEADRLFEEEEAKRLAEEANNTEEEKDEE